MTFAIWCQPKDGSENGKWFRLGACAWVFSLIQDAILQKEKLEALKNWGYEVREYHG